MFSSVTPAPTTYTATFENGTMATETANFLNYPTGGNRSALELFDHTDFSGSTYTYSNLLNGGNNSQVGLAKTIKVYPGDKVKLEAFAKYYNPQGTGNLSGFAAALTTAFGVSAASTGEAALAYQTLNTYGGVVAGGGGNGNSSYPKAFVTILLFDKDYKLVDFTFDQINGGQQVGVSPKAAHDAMMCEYTVKEAGYAYMYISNENPTMVEVYFDDIAVTYTPSNLIQGNEYYPFGMQTANSWTRDGNKNDYLYNQGTELNATSGWYETFFRGYDPALGKFLQVDPMTDKYASWTPYNYGFNSPGVFNDPLGDDAGSSIRGGYSYASMGGCGCWVDKGPQDAHAGMYGDSFGNSGTTGAITRSGNTFTIRWNQVGSNGGVWDAHSGYRDFSNFSDAISFSLANLSQTGGWQYSAFGALPGEGRRLAVHNGNGDYVELGANGQVYVPYTNVSYWSYLGLTSVGSDGAAWNMEAFAYAGGASLALLADDITVAGTFDDIAIPFIYAGATTVFLYQNKDLIAKQAREIANLRNRSAGPQGYTYMLTVNVPGTYRDVRGNAVALNIGDVWKLYTKGQLDTMIPGGVTLIPIYFGNQVEIKIAEKTAIYGYFFQNGSLPPGNRIFR